MYIVTQLLFSTNLFLVLPDQIGSQRPRGRLTKTKYTTIHIFGLLCGETLSKMSCMRVKLFTVLIVGQMEKVPVLNLAWDLTWQLRLDNKMHDPLVIKFRTKLFQMQSL